MYDTFATPLAVVILVGFIAALVYNFTRRKLDSFENLAITFALVYGLFIVLSSTFSRYERINPRLLSHLCIYLLLGLHQLGYVT
jgi:4-amino-4-deoxy-L-arabinose transferase-like glycosyltransferase